MTRTGSSMGGESRRDRTRRLANVIGALFQVGATAAAGAGISAVIDAGARSPVEPAGYAFGIWALIFILSLTYAVYQALPKERENPLLRSIGPFTAAALYWSHVNPYGTFRLDMERRLDLDRGPADGPNGHDADP